MIETTSTQNADVNNSTNQPEFLIYRIYIKDLSIELPNSPSIFAKEWKPEIELNVKVDHQAVQDWANDTYEVMLALKLTAKLPENQTALLIELIEAGLFKITGWQGENLENMLRAFCPNIIFPYAREIIADSMARTGLPPLHLAPINFDALYEQHKKQQQINK